MTPPLPINSERNGDDMKVRTVILATALLLVTTACGDDGNEAAPTKDLKITAEDFKFGPANWTVPAGEFNLTFTNGGMVEHEWAILNKGVHITSEDEFSEEIVLTELEKVPPGETETATFTIDEPGEYQVICALDGHLNAGMTGTLTVVG